jgi:hypothetical protein
MQKSSALPIQKKFDFQSLPEKCQIIVGNALKKTIGKLDINIIDNELAKYVSYDSLKRVAAFGLRGEVFFPVPCILEKNPFLIGYYRLLFGLSQKEFYNKGPFGRFKRLEDRGDITKLQKPHILALCKSLVNTAQALVDGIDEISLQTIHELQLLTLGPQLRGGANTKIGQVPPGYTYLAFGLTIGMPEHFFDNHYKT